MDDERDYIDLVITSSSNCELLRERLDITDMDEDTASQVIKNRIAQPDITLYVGDKIEILNY